MWVLRLVEKLEVVPVQYLKKLTGTDELWEVRIQVSGNSYRLIGSFDEATVLILTNGFPKKERKLPGREILKALDRRLDYFRRRDPK